MKEWNMPVISELDIRETAKGGTEVTELDGYIWEDPTTGERNAQFVPEGHNS